MNYLIFHNSIVWRDGIKISILDKEIQEFVKSMDKVKLCVVDVDVLMATSVEFPVEKKDSILVRKFKEFYPQEPYVIQDERIDQNLFQIIGIKERIVREVYSIIPAAKIEAFIPYGIALRNMLMQQAIDLKRTIVFVDDFKTERLLTVFDGLTFSRTRAITATGGDLLTEIKRSQIDFYKKTEEFKVNQNNHFAIIVNNQTLANEIQGMAEGISIEYFDVVLPALEGLKGESNSIRYSLPEEGYRKVKEIEFKKKIRALCLSSLIAAIGLIYFIFNSLEMNMVKNKYRQAQQINEQLESETLKLDQETYRVDLKSHQTLNYGITYLSMLNIIPSSYVVQSFKFQKIDHWTIEMILFPDNNELVDAIPKIKILRNAEIKDIFVNNQPGKHLRLTV